MPRSARTKCSTSDSTSEAPNAAQTEEGLVPPDRVGDKCQRDASGQVGIADRQPKALHAAIVEDTERDSEMPEGTATKKHASSTLHRPLQADTKPPVRTGLVFSARRHVRNELLGAAMQAADKASSAQAPSPSPIGARRRDGRHGPCHVKP
eukprot:356171-Hanusia_phi.AAC.3